MDRGTWWATLHGITESGMTERMRTHTHFDEEAWVLSLINHSWPEVLSQLATNIYSAVPM